MEWDCGQGVVFVFSAAEDMTIAHDMNGGFLTSALLESGIARPPSIEHPLTIGGVFEEIRASVSRQNREHELRAERDGEPQEFRQIPVLSCSHFPSLSSPLYF